MKRALTFALMLVLAAGHASAQQPKQVGTWFVQTDKDRFTDDTTVIAMTMNNGGILAVRCLSPGRFVTIAIRHPVVKDLTPGENFLVDYKGGKSPVLHTMADAVGTDMLEVFVTKEMRPTLFTADEYAFRFHSKNQQLDTNGE
jgi:hypothetical protein